MKLRNLISLLMTAEADLDMEVVIEFWNTPPGTINQIAVEDGKIVVCSDQEVVAVYREESVEFELQDQD